MDLGIVNIKSLVTALILPAMIFLFVDADHYSNSDIMVFRN